MGFTESRKRTTAGDPFLTEFVKSKTFPFLPSAKTPVRDVTNKDNVQYSAGEQ